MYIDINYLNRLLTGNEIEAIIKFLHEGKPRVDESKPEFC